MVARRNTRSELVALVLATAVMLFVQIWLGVWQQVHFQTAAFDLGLFSQEISAWAHFHLPRSTLDMAAHHDALGEHFSPVLAVLAPVWRVFPTPMTLLVAQAILVAASVPAVLIVAFRRLGWIGATAFGLAYLTSWELLAMGEYQFHELAFAVPIVAWALERADAGKWNQATVIMATLLLVKEDMALVAATFGVLLFLSGHRRTAVALTSACLVWFLTIVGVVMPDLARSPSGGTWGTLYSDLSSTPAALPGSLLRHPSRLIIGLTAGARTKLTTLLAALASYLGLSVFSPIALLAVPVLVSRFYTTSPSRWTMFFQYNAVLAPILAFAAIDTLVRARRRWQVDSRQMRRILSFAAELMVIVPFFMGSFSPLSTVKDHLSLSPTANEVACTDIADEADRIIPPQAQVESTSWMTPRLVSHLTNLYLPNMDPNPPAYLILQAGPWDNSLPGTAVLSWLAHRAPDGFQVLAHAGTCQVLKVNRVLS
jgi:uncharacterized membrane protein